MGAFAKCRLCGAQIMWVKTTAGKNMPVNPEFIPYRHPKEGEKGEERLVRPNGEVISAIRTDAGSADGNGYISHFATCPKAKKARRK